MEELLLKTADLLSGIQTGNLLSGDGKINLIVAILIAMAAMMFFLVYIVLRKNSGEAPQGAFELGRGLMGRLEKLEMTLNSMKTEVTRSNHWVKLELDNLKLEVESIRHTLGAVKPEGLFESSPEEDLVETEEEAPLSEPVEDGAVDAPAEKKTLKTEEPPAPVPQDTLSTRLSSTRESLFGRLKLVLGLGPKLDEAALEELEARLIESDLGVKTATTLVDQVRAEVQSGGKVDEGALAGILKIKILKILEQGEGAKLGIAPRRSESGPFVVLLVGVNGAGKTTTAAKLASQWKEAGHKIMLAAADTFRAAAVEQLCEWGRRLDVPVISGAAEAKPATVVFDAMEKAREAAVDVLIIDTAGRLHTKANLMQEMEGILRVIQRHQPDAPHEIVLVVDGATGQNAINQAREFHEALKLTGIIITKLDGTPKGGMVVAIKNELGIPVRYIGVGETPRDLRPFSARDFVEALFWVAPS